MSTVSTPADLSVVGAGGPTDKQEPVFRPAGSLRPTEHTSVPSACGYIFFVDSGLAGKRVLVTGASGGIGGERPRAFAAEGCEVVAHWHRGEESARSLATEIGCLLVQADLTLPRDVDR